MLICMGCIADHWGTTNCSIKMHDTKCYEEVACPGNPEDEGYYCPEGQESYEKQICNSSECEEYYWYQRSEDANIDCYYRVQHCPSMIDNAPEDCHLICDCYNNAFGNPDDHDVGEEYYCLDDCGYKLDMGDRTGICHQGD